MDEPLRVGLVGAGPWARTVHAPGLADHPATRLSAVFTRRVEAGRELAEPYDAEVCTSLDELLGQVDAVAFAVPPATQAELAVEAVKAGKHVILEKPIAADVAGAERLADAVSGAGVVSLVMLTLRYATATRDWLAGLAAAGSWSGGGVRWLSGGLLGGPYSASPWRQEDGGTLADVGPHAVDLLDAALGPIERVRSAHRGPHDLWHIVFQHEGGALSSATLSLRLPLRPTVVEFAVYGEHGYRTLGRKEGGAGQSYTAMLDDFAALIDTGTTSHPCDVHRGLHIQRLLDSALSMAR
ncbi:Gfo/Idh/MocA family oxidoreductase [Amycolatopsis thermalba]|uniref:Gfo/Idh/MocA family oxidoreductase n=1 Tax=Amycolatopsis thermalba TaxID=944492 RepID=A0ABY4NM78_9PSEU|nr:MULTISPECIES: Gfo/Idh/MocA family oxidoreductase [Amycolatopsis]OXM74735.1 dehydrogenase [Amycolatopsis sp. KNN50.9b]UQS21579.1 Gfo/Idh/MocA family oxidoreductase [Amycolatopsis thermalba]